MFNYTDLSRGVAARPDCAVHRPSPLGPRFALGLLAYLSHRSHVLTPVWLRSPFRLSKLTPFRVVFSAKSFSEKFLRYVPSVARFLKVAFQGPFLWTLLLVVRLQDIALTRFAYFLFFRAFFSVTVLGLLHFSDSVFPTYST